MEPVALRRWHEPVNDRRGSCSTRIINQDGRLVCQERKPAKGSYSNTCRNCTSKKVNGSSMLDCECRNKRGHYQRSRLWKRGCKGDISNLDGRLTCSADIYWSKRIYGERDRYLQRCRKRHVRGADARLEGECRTCRSCPFYSTSIDLAKCVYGTVQIKGGRVDPARLTCTPNRSGQKTKMKAKARLRR